MPLSLKAQYAKAQKRREKIVSRVYDCAPNDRTPFNDCLKLAPATLRDEYNDSMSECVRVECEAVAAGKAYRSTFNMLTWYR